MTKEERNTQAETMWKFLTTGTPPQGFRIAGFQPLAPDQAMHIIYLIQEYLHALPDHFEMCEQCGYFFNSEEEYCVSEPRLLCNDCAPLEEQDEQEG